jgi:hypothetical protein
VELEDAQIQSDILQVKNFKGPGEIWHETHKIGPLQQLSQDTANEGTGCQKKEQREKTLGKTHIKTPIDFTF